VLFAALAENERAKQAFCPTQKHQPQQKEQAGGKKSAQ
jgi:hypothetical protein